MNHDNTDRRLAPIDHDERLPSRGLALTNFDDMQRFARAACSSGFFKTGKDLAAAVVTIQWGAELGLGPVTALQGMYNIGGKPGMMAALMAAQIKRFGYRYRVTKMTSDEVVIDFFERVDGKWEKIGSSSFSVDDARQAKLTGGNYDKFPRNMLWARAMSNGARWYCSDAFGGAPVYTPEELGADVDDDGVPTSAPRMMPEPVPVVAEVVEEQTVDLSYDLRDLGAIVAAMSFCEDRAELNALKPRIDSEALTDEDADLVRFYWGYVARLVDGNHKAAADYLKLDGHAAKWEQVEELIPSAVVEEEEPPARAPAEPVEEQPAFVDCPEFVPDLKNEGDCMRCGEGVHRHRAVADVGPVEEAAPPVEEPVAPDTHSGGDDLGDLPF